MIIDYCSLSFSVTQYFTYMNFNIQIKHYTETQHKCFSFIYLIEDFDPLYCRMIHPY